MQGDSFNSEIEKRNQFSFPQITYFPQYIFKLNHKNIWMT